MEIKPTDRKLTFDSLCNEIDTECETYGLLNFIKWFNNQSIGYSEQILFGDSYIFDNYLSLREDLKRWLVKKGYAEKILEYKLPIFAVRGNSVHTLIPHVSSVTSYDWYDIDNNTFNSCMNYRTIKKAIDAYSRYEIIYNGRLVMENGN